MYTFAPLANINTVDDHGFFYALVVFVAVFWLIMLYQCRDDLQEAGWSTVVMLVFLGICGFFSYNSGEIKNYENKQVQAEFVEFVAEGFNITEYHGKYSSRVDKHFTYVVYKVDGNNVMLPAQTGQTYPQTIVLYKN